MESAFNITKRVNSFKISSVNDNEVTVELNFSTKVYEELSNLNVAKVKVSLSGKNVTLPFFELSEDGKTVYFKGEIDGEDILKMEYHGLNKIVTLKGLIDADEVNAIAVVEYNENGDVETEAGVDKTEDQKETEASDRIVESDSGDDAAGGKSTARVGLIVAVVASAFLAVVCVAFVVRKRSRS